MPSRRHIALAILPWLILTSSVLGGQPSKIPPFSLRDDIALVEFINPGAQSPIASWSRDGSYIAVVTQGGIIDRNSVEAKIHVFSAADIAGIFKFHERTTRMGRVIATATAPSGREVIKGLRWMSDSKRLIFLAENADGTRSLCITTVTTGKVMRLSEEGQNVVNFDENNGFIAYSVAVPEPKEFEGIASPVETVGTGKNLSDLLRLGRRSDFSGRAALWIVKGNNALPLKDLHGGSVQVPEGESEAPSFRISPDGKKIIAQQVVHDVPKSWELYRPSDDLPARRIKAGEQDAESNDDPVKQFVLIDTDNGLTNALSIGPIGWQDAYYGAVPDAGWSADSQHVVLSNVFLHAPEHPNFTRSELPCVGLVDITSMKASCALSLPTSRAEMFRAGESNMSDPRFVGDGFDEIAISTSLYSGGGAARVTTLTRGPGDMWVSVADERDSNKAAPFEVFVRQGMNSPPKLAAKNISTGEVRNFFDPNPEMENVELGNARLFTWLDSRGNRWTGGLLLPQGAAKDGRYPLVIQTHGFRKDIFFSHGAFTTGMAARELAASGIAVLQVGDPDDPLVKMKNLATPNEGEMYLAGYRGAIDALNRQGLIDAERVGVTGFSRTVYHVMFALTDNPATFATASITDGIDVGYIQSFFDPDGIDTEYGNMIGAKPLGAGLRRWLEHSPGFNLDKVIAPLQVVALGRESLLMMWSDYAVLRYQGKPSDITLLETEEHVLTNPLVRLASQGGTLDWFRFWLQGYEDPKPDKRAQYARWEHLCDLQIANKTNHLTRCVPSVPTH